MRKVILSQPFKEKHRRSPNDFTRDRKLPFHLVLLLILNGLRGSILDELDEFFQRYFRWFIPRRYVTPSAFCQARRKLSFQAFVDLLDVVCTTLNQAGQLRTFKGMRVFAIDGSTVRLADNQVVRDHFGAASNNKAEVAMSRASILFDVLNRITYHAILGNYCTGEISMGWQHIDDARLPEGSLVIFDRGYYDFMSLQNLLLQDLNFCIRLRSNLPIYKTFMKMDVDEAWLTLKPPGKYAKRKESHVFHRPIRVRLVRYRVGGKRYILMTNLLSGNVVSCEELGDLYHHVGKLRKVTR